ncbi:S-adenosyl-L-methionine-dependent methyltransferase [Coniophora puteana RWD-64-598 SS2]|uniref:S-adenosyl-L-methionine-dependent methyltransferase n=1 Tax=Coniophora puteana (strain RWD-64-598) TaxID=741705 RepID=A0A5M3N0I4_CONPW|nr:S-adenosyl-L-methionine-dependent methyltransferase [Coniophora puteana RWD-64-598 SS2]EIW84786.1 S-adenosyl-L-methionine-dependent methyltransferase [Coniophora puteana RWD-64-598 SS2]
MTSTDTPHNPDWAHSIRFHNSFLLERTAPGEAERLAAIEHALANSAAHGLPQISVARNEGKFLRLVARSIGAKRVLEVGTLGGVSSIWIAQGLPPDGRIVTLELSEERAKVAKQNWEAAGIAHQISIIVGDAVASITALHPSESEPFDMAFIDADKKSNPTYFREAKRLVRSGGVIIVDNVIRRGRIADLSNTQPDQEGTREMLRMIKEDAEVDATTIATAGEKSFDGFLYAIRL